jgi:hypothetical protein
MKDRTLRRRRGTGRGGEEGHDEGHDDGVGVKGLLQDPHPHAKLGLATSFAHLSRIVKRTWLSSSLLATGEFLVLLCCALIENLILIY